MRFAFEKTNITHRYRGININVGRLWVLIQPWWIEVAWFSGATFYTDGPLIANYNSLLWLKLATQHGYKRRFLRWAPLLKIGKWRLI